MKIQTSILGFVALLAIMSVQATNTKPTPSTNTSKAEKSKQTTSNSKTKNKTSKATSKSIVFGAGCFWGVEKRFEKLAGVSDVVSGYADGKGFTASYKNITHPFNRLNPYNYAEVVKVTYNPNDIGLEKLMQFFFETHNPTQGNRQGNDRGTQYRSTILYTTDAEQKLATRVRDEYQKLLTQNKKGSITTKIAKLDTFVNAEDYHQDYLQKNPNGYCVDTSTGVTFPKEVNKNYQQPMVTTPKMDTDMTQKTIDNSALQTGKHILVLESADCPYCKAFRDNVANDYQGEASLHYRTDAQLDGLQLTTDTSATPTIFFIEDGKEVFAHRGLMNNKDFYRGVGTLMLGKDSTAFDVAFNEGTERRFCQKYEQFKNTGDGMFVDAMSGKPLFDTKHRFNSGSGWLSFTQAVPGSTVEIFDTSYGMRRVEVRTKVSDIHLGHVFEDGPNGQRRFCINANVLKFVPKEK